MRLNLADVVNELAVDTITVTRTTASQTVTSEGFIVPGAIETITMAALVVPVTGDSMTRTDEGQRVTGEVTIYATAPLQAADADPASGSSRQRADVVTWQSRAYEVTSVAHWQSHGMFYEATAQEIRR